MYDPCWLGDALLAAGKITSAQLASAIRRFKEKPHQPFEQVLETLALADQYTIATFVAKHHHLDFVALPPGTIPPAVASLLAAPRARAACAVPIEAAGQNLTVAVADPRNYRPHDAYRDFPGKTVRLVVSPRNDILTTIETANRPSLTADAPPSERFQAILVDAITKRASDIHLETQPNALVVRYRIDDALIHQAHLDNTLKILLVQAAKQFATLDLAEKRLPQDGRGRMTLGAQTYSFRVNCAPAHYGENVVIRIQNEGCRTLTPVELGLQPHTIKAFDEIMAEPNGILYVTGPTGSGKTTLLFSLLATQPTAEEKIITIEDPIEIVVPAYQQHQIDDSIGRTFPVMMGALVRQDPDRILLGETRDAISAQIAIQAALTGHKVYSTLHTNDAPSAIPRLVDIGLEPYLIASALKGIAACRLVPRLCTHCREPVQGDKLAYLTETYGPGDYYRANHDGCPECIKGYRGRISIVEVYPTKSPEIQKLILKKASVADLRVAFASALHLPDMRADGIVKARAGIITIEDVLSQA
jgi:type II secretory ATPase GspE/PulE/Tfp pilus assembly ATPase PilB-like protein